jgi:AraC-like DNA-binding protein
MAVESYFKIFLLTGSALSLLMAIFLWLNSYKLFANKVLGVMNIFWSFIVFIFAIQSNEFYVKFPHLFKLTSIIPIALFPLLYVYIRSFLTGSKWRVKELAVHFIPMLLYFIAISPFYFQSTEVKRELIRTGGFPHFLGTVGAVFDVVIILQGIIYTALSMKTIQKYFDTTAGNLSKQQRYVLNWLIFFVMSYVLLWAFGAVGAMLEMLDINVPFDMFNFFYLGLTILTISIGVFALRRPSILFRRMQLSSSKGKLTPEELNFNVDEGEDELKLILDYLEKEKAYLKNDLSLQDLTEATGVPKHRISALLNNKLGKNFYEILNEYRTNEAIRLFNDGKHLNFTLTYIAEMAGFNSRATFNRIFKKITNQTPSEYIHSVYSDNQKDNQDS